MRSEKEKTARKKRYEELKKQKDKAWKEGFGPQTRTRNGLCSRKNLTKAQIAARRRWNDIEWEMQLCSSAPLKVMTSDMTDLERSQAEEIEKLKEQVAALQRDNEI